MFGTLVKGLRFGLDLLMVLQNEGHIIELLLKLFKVPTLSGSGGLDRYLSQFEAAVDSDFPNYQVYIYIYFKYSYVVQKKFLFLFFGVKKLIVEL